MKKTIPSVTKESFIDIALDTISLGKQLIMFVGSKRSAEACAENIAKKVTDVNLNELSVNIETVLAHPTKQCRRLALCVKRGIAFHHSGLASKQRELIEKNFRRGRIKVICATPTLAAGVDLPAFRTVIKDLKRYSGGWGSNWIPVLEFLQMAGRAGRPGMEDFGEAILIAKSEHDKDLIYEKYILGVPEPIYSKLAVEPVLRIYVLSLVAMGAVNSKSELLKFFSKTFWAYQYEDLEKLKNKILGVISTLQQYGFVSALQEDFVSASSFLSDGLSATPMGKRVAQLYIDPLTAHNILEGIKNANAHTSVFAFLQLITSQLEMRPLIRPRVKDLANVQQAALSEEFLVEQPMIYDDIHYADFVASVKTALFFNDWINERDEPEILELHNVRPGEIRLKVEKMVWLLYATTELCRITKKHDLRSVISKLRFRVKNGVKEEVIPLLHLRGIGRARARKLFNNGIKTLADVRNSDIRLLSRIIGDKIAKDIHEQVGATKNEMQAHLND